ncbi:LuxR C-terminal-related transcriptional regulator [Wenyingzhuangia sp. 1_MG-2023]|nr:LuxR C-terminal-related transcriptional regulator [Wenyingzhuangia sp. 1_MG-2023]
MKENLDFYNEIFKSHKQYEKTVVEKHIQKLRELDEYLPPIQSFFAITNTTKQAYEFLSKNFDYTLGLDRKKIAELGVPFMLSHFHPDDLSIWLHAIEDLMKFTMSEVPFEDRVKLSYTLNFRIKNAKGEYLNAFDHQTPAYFDDQGKPVIGITHCTIIGNGEPRPIIGSIKILNDNDEYEMLYHKNYSQKLLTSSLTNREIDVLRLLSINNTSKQIAEKLFISSHTVDTHRKNIYKKLNINSTVDLVKQCLINQFL